MAGKDSKNQKEEADVPLSSLVELKALIPELRSELAKDDDLDVNIEEVSDDALLPFLRWKLSVKRAAERFRAHFKWRKENPWAFDSNTGLLADQDDELKRVILSNVLIAPDTLVDKEGSPVLLGRLRNNDMSDGRTVQGVCRMIFYNMDRALERLNKNDSLDEHEGVTLFHDLKGLSRQNIDPNIPRILFNALIGHFPLRIKQIYILNAPWFFYPMFNIMSTMFFSAKLKERTHFVKSLDDIYEVIDRDLLLPEHGGKLEFDTSMWVEEQIQREKDGSMTSLKDCLVLNK